MEHRKNELNQKSNKIHKDLAVISAESKDKLQSNEVPKPIVITSDAPESIQLNKDIQANNVLTSLVSSSKFQHNLLNLKKDLLFMDNNSIKHFINPGDNTNIPIKGKNVYPHFYSDLCEQLIMHKDSYQHNSQFYHHNPDSNFFY